MIEYLHKTTLKMLKEVVRIFDQNDISYMICGGTLLGAITSKSFIPWDDDVDLCVLENDYDRMKKVLLDSLPQWMVLQCSETEPHYYHSWLKVRDKASIVYPNEVNYLYNGVWIDIYKLSPVKLKDVPYLVCKEHIDYLYRRSTMGCITKEELDRRLQENHLKERLVFEEKVRKTSNDDKVTYIIWSASKILIEQEWCTSTKYYSFEGVMLKSFNNPDAYLRRHYGDNYTVFPPDDMRRVGINKVDY